jgi:hypothetical protein
MRASAKSLTCALTTFLLQSSQRIEFDLIALMTCNPFGPAVDIDSLTDRDGGDSTRSGELLSRDALPALNIAPRAIENRLGREYHECLLDSVCSSLSVSTSTLHLSSLNSRPGILDGACSRLVPSHQS